MRVGGGANPLVVALDVSDLARAEALAAALANEVGLLKVGLELFTAAGPEASQRIRGHAPVFLDLKLHDIPTTVGRAARNAGRLEFNSRGCQLKICREEAMTIFAKFANPVSPVRTDPEYALSDARRAFEIGFERMAA